MYVYLRNGKNDKEKENFKTEISKLQKSVVLELPNPSYREIQNNHQHLRERTLNNYDTKSELPIHYVLVITQKVKRKTPESENRFARGTDCRIN